MKKIHLAILALLIFFSVSIILAGCTLFNDCQGLGQPGPGFSLDPNDPNKDKKCCGDLVLRGQKSSFRSGCEMAYGGGMVCLACGDGICDTNYESECNCAEDCK